MKLIINSEGKTLKIDDITKAGLGWLLITILFCGCLIYVNKY